MANIDLSPLLAAVQQEYETLNNALKDKGAKHFGRPLGLGIVILVSCYALVNYVLQPSKQMKVLDKQISAARATAQYADSYNDVHLRLLSYYAQLPYLKDRDQWLYNSLIEWLKADNIISDSLAPPSEEEIPPGLVFQNETMATTIKFNELVAWLSRVEKSKPVVHVSSLELNKKADPVGANGVVCIITTIIPKVKY